MIIPARMIFVRTVNAPIPRETMDPHALPTSISVRMISAAAAYASIIQRPPAHTASILIPARRMTYATAAALARARSNATMEIPAQMTTAIPSGAGASREHQPTAQAVMTATPVPQAIRASPESAHLARRSPAHPQTNATNQVYAIRLQDCAAIRP